MEASLSYIRVKERERKREGGDPKVPETSNGRQHSLEKAKVSVVSLAPKR